jgi:hypothetical protein
MLHRNSVVLWPLNPYACGSAMRVNGFDLPPGAFQITITFEPQQGSRVVCNCRNYGDAMVTLERLLNDPRHELKDLIKFQVLDHEGNVYHFGHFDSWHFLRGEELAQREVAWSFGHSERVHFSASSRAFVLFVTGISRTIYHVFWLAVYLFVFGLVIAIPLLFLSILWSWIAQLMHG